MAEIHPAASCVSIPMGFHQQGHGENEGQRAWCEPFLRGVDCGMRFQKKKKRGSRDSGTIPSSPHSGRLPTALSGLGEQDWETDKCRTEAGSFSFDRIAFESKTGSSLGPRRWTPECVSGFFALQKRFLDNFISPNNDIQVRRYPSDLQPACAKSYSRQSQSIHPSWPKMSKDVSISRAILTAVS